MADAGAVIAEIPLIVVVLIGVGLIRTWGILLAEELKLRIAHGAQNAGLSRET